MSNGKAPRILIVDDEQMIRDQLRFNIRKSLGDAVSVQEAADGPEAIEATNTFQFDCIISDLRMPNTEPHSFFQQIKSSKLNRETPLLVLTGFPDDSLLHKFNPLILLNKPTPMNDLIRLIESQIKLGRLSDRVPTPLMGPLLSTIGDFLTEGIHIQNRTESSLPKLPGAQLGGDILTILDVSWGFYHARLGIGFEKKFLDQIQKRDQIENRETLVQTAERLSYVIYDRVCDVIMSQANCRPLLNSTRTFTAQNQREATLQSAKGLATPIETEYGRILVYLLNRVEEQAAA